MDHFEKKTLKNLEIFERKKCAVLKKVTGKSNAPSLKNFFFLKMTQEPNAPSPNTFSFENFPFSLFFLGKIWEYWFFFFWIFFLNYIHEQSTSNATWIFGIQINIETWNKQANSNLNIGHLLLLGPFRMLKTWYAWTLIMMKWSLLEMAWACTWKA